MNELIVWKSVADEELPLSCTSVLVCGYLPFGPWGESLERCIFVGWHDDTDGLWYMKNGVTVPIRSRIVYWAHFPKGPIDA